MKALLDLPQLRKGIRAVGPHVLKSKDGLDLTHMRVTLTQGQAWLQASNGVSLALASVDSDGEQELTGDLFADSFELTPSVIATVLAAFQARSGDDEMQQEVQVRTSRDDEGEWVEFEDVSGLFPGQALRVPRAPRPDHFPNVFRVVRDRLTASPLTEVTAESGPVGKVRLEDITASVKLFAAAESAYGTKALFQATQGERTLVVTCGEHFAGALISSGWIEDREIWHRDHDTSQKRLVDELQPLAAGMAATDAKRSARAS